MKALRYISIVALIFFFLALIAGNIFYIPIRNFIESNFLPLVLSENEVKLLNQEKVPDYSITVFTDKSVYSKFEKIKLFGRITGKDGKSIPEKAVFKVELFQNGAKIKNLDGLEQIVLKFNKDESAWIGYFYPESPSIEGNISVNAYGYIDEPVAPVNGSASFYIKEKTPVFTLDKGRAFMGIDSLERISKRSILSTDGREVDWTYIPEWINYISADGIIMLGGITKSFDENVTLEQPWDRDKINEALALSDRLKQKGKSFGLYLRGLRAEGIDAKKIGYKMSVIYREDKYVEDASIISLKDENRVKNIVKLINTFVENNNVSFIGFSDIVLPPYYGMELFEQYIKEFQLDIPQNWTNMDFDSKYSYFKDKMKDSRNFSCFVKWKNFFIADYIHDLIEKSGHKRPFFYVTDLDGLISNPYLLSLLFNSGIDFVIINFNIPYIKITDVASFLSKNQEVSRYLNRVIVAYYFDYQNVDIEDSEVSALENFVEANLQLVKGGSQKAIANGILINDLYKIMFGKRGPYSPNEWMLGVGETIYKFKSLYNTFPIHLSIDLKKDSSRKEMDVQVNAVNVLSRSINNVKVEYFPNFGKMSQKNNSVKTLNPGKEIGVGVSLQMDTNASIFMRKKDFIGLRFSWDEETENKATVRNGFLIFEPVSMDDKQRTNIVQK